MGFREMRKKFLGELTKYKKTEKEWKEPNIDSIYYYQDRQLPHIFLEDISSEETTRYLGENKYSFRTENLSKEENYELVRKLINRTIDWLGDITADTPKRKVYEEFCQRANTKLNISAFFKTKQNNIEKAAGLLEGFLPETIDFYNSILKDETEMVIE